MTAHADVKRPRPLSAALSALMNGLVAASYVPALFMLIIPDSDRIVGMRALGWFVVFGPFVNAIAAVLALFSISRPRLRAFTWAVAIGGFLYVAYVIVGGLIWLG